MIGKGGQRCFNQCLGIEVWNRYDIFRGMEIVSIFLYILYK